MEAAAEDEAGTNPVEITPDPLSDDFLSWVKLTSVSRPGTWPDRKREDDLETAQVLSSYVNADQRALHLQTTRKEKLVQSSIRELEAATKKEAQCKQKVLEAEGLLATLEDQYEKLLEQLQEASEGHSGPSEKMRILSERLDECVRAMEEQQLAVVQAEKKKEVALASRLMLEVQTRGLEEIGSSPVHENGERDALRRLAQLRRQKEPEAAKRYHKESLKLKLLAHKASQKRAEQDEAVVQEAEEGRRYASQKMKERLEMIRHHEIALDSGHNTERTRKVSALLQLKKESDAIKADLEAKNVTRHRRQKLKEEARAKEAEDLLQAGRNPYEVFRMREQEAARVREKARTEEKRRQQAADFVVKMEQEKVQVEKVTAKMKAFEERQVPAKLDDPDKWRKYLDARALPGVELSEITKPGGFLPSKIADPSKIMNKYQLGLGIAAKSTVNALQKVYHETPSELLIPRSPNKQSQPSDGKIDVAEEGEGENARPRPRALSVWETRRLTDARARAKASMTRKQVVWGKEFTGDAFLPKPAAIVFKDFEVGKVYRRRFTLTNVSYTFNTFKIGDLSDAVKDFFVVEYEFPGQVSAGVSCEVTITFTPKLNEDIFEELPVLAQTGRMTVPLRCLIKRTVISTDLADGRLDFGMVTLAEKAVRSLTVENRGALPTDFEIGEQSGEESSVLTYMRTGRVEGYSKTRVDFTYAPLEEGPLHQTLLVNFSSADVQSITLDVSGASGNVPVYLDGEEVDFRCCVYDQIYRNVLVVGNRGKTAMKVMLTVPAALSGCLQIVPNLGYVQAGSKFSFQMKFTPVFGLLDRCTPHSDAEKQTLSVPFRLKIPEQTFPVTAVIKATLTSAELTFTPATLDFGTCPVGESVSCPLNLTNPSFLPLRYGVNPLPKGVTIKPGDGFGTLLPSESVTRSILFTPRAGTLYSFHLPVTNTLAPGKPASIPCTGMGILTPLVFSSNRVELPATPVGSSSTVNLLLKNVSASQQTFEFTPPSDATLRISPLVDTIEPGRTVTIRLDFRPTEDSVPNLKTASNSFEENKGESFMNSRNEMEASEREAKDYQEPVSKTEAPADPPYEKAARLCLQKQVVIPCLIKKRTKTSEAKPVAEAGYSGGESPFEKIGNASRSFPGSVTMYLEVHTTIIEPQLAIKDSPGGPDDRGFYPLDFGQIPVGKRVIKTFTIGHVGSQRLSLRASPLGHDGVFARVNALRELCPSEMGDNATSQLTRGSPDESVRSSSSQLREAPEADVSRDLPLESEGLGGSEARQMNGVEKSASGDSGGIDPPGQIVEELKPSNPSRRLIEQKVAIEFAPTARIRYKEVLNLYSQGGLGATHLKVLLVGEGISPTMHLDPDISALDLGHVLAGESTEKSFVVVNTSPFPLTFRLRLHGTLRRNQNGMEPIYCKPAEGTIEAGARAPVSVVFNPDRPGSHYRAQLQVEVPNQDKEVKLNLTGSCWDQALFFTGFDAAADYGEQSSESWAPPKRVTVTLSQKGPSATVVVGCTEAKAGGKGATGEFVIEGLEKGSVNATGGWSVDVSRGSLAPGEKKPVTVSFSVPHKGEESLVALGETVEAKVILQLKGGSPPPREPQIALLLRYSPIDS